MKGSWKTTVCGIVGIIGGGLMQFFPQYGQLGGFLASVSASVGLLFARDNNKRSEDVIKTP